LPYFAVIALLILLMIKQSSWIWPSLYIQFHTLSEVSFALGLQAVSVICCFALLHRGLGQVKTSKLVNICVALLAVYVLDDFLERFGLIPTQFASLYKVFVVVSAIAAGLLALKISLDTWKRLHLACIVGGVIFIFSPVVMANMNAVEVYWPSPSYQPPTIVAPNMPAQNTIVLLLDELSASAAGPIIENLQAASFHVKATKIDPAGKNTINVIPAIWMRTSFEKSDACGLTQLCSETKVLDFSKVKASSDNIDIVGTFHRYCSIQGLRFCSFGSMSIRSASREFACGFPWKHVVKILVNKSEFCDPSPAERKSFSDLIHNMQKNLLEAPFWQKGGILFAHLLVPHPLLGAPSKTLSEEYSENIASGASLVKLVAEKARLVFGDDFRIIVFSDHSLRPEVWCTGKIYREPECKRDASQLSTQVPLIIASSSENNTDVSQIKNNMAVFDLLFQLDDR
jgi:hypothetical protein